MAVLVKEALRVFVDGEETSGVIFYGLRPYGSSQIKFPAHLWPPNHRLRPSRLLGESWEIVLWDLGLNQWPSASNWVDTVRQTLAVIVESGCVVAWMGSEGLPVSDPPHLFSPEQMPSSVLAALTAQGDFFEPPSLDSPVRTLNSSELKFLRKRATGLADADDYGLMVGLRDHVLELLSEDYYALWDILLWVPAERNQLTQVVSELVRDRSAEWFVRLSPAAPAQRLVDVGFDPPVLDRAESWEVPEGASPEFLLGITPKGWLDYFGPGVPWAM